MGIKRKKRGKFVLFNGRCIWLGFPCHLSRPILELVLLRQNSTRKGFCAEVYFCCYVLRKHVFDFCTGFGQNFLLLVEICPGFRFCWQKLISFERKPLLTKLSYFQVWWMPVHLDTVKIRMRFLAYFPLLSIWKDLVANIKDLYVPPKQYVVRYFCCFLQHCSDM